MYIYSSIYKNTPFSSQKKVGQLIKRKRVLCWSHLYYGWTIQPSRWGFKTPDFWSIIRKIYRTRLWLIYNFHTLIPNEKRGKSLWYLSFKKVFKKTRLMCPVTILDSFKVTFYIYKYIYTYCRAPRGPWIYEKRVAHLALNI